MKNLWPIIGAGMILVAAIAFLVMSDTANAPGHSGRKSSESEGTLEFKVLETEPEQREEAGVEFDGKVLTVYGGMKPTGGHGLEIDSITETEDKLSVRVIESVPGEDCIVTQALTYPQVTVRLNKQVDKPVNVVTERMVQDCQ